MKKRRPPTKQAIQRKSDERDAKRAHTLEVNETRAKGFEANNETLIAKIEQQYQDGEISIHQWEWAISQLKGDSDSEAEQQPEAKETKTEKEKKA